MDIRSRAGLRSRWTVVGVLLPSLAIPTPRMALAQEPPQDAVAAADSHLMFLGAPDHAGVPHGGPSGIPGAPRIAWRFETGGPVRSSAAVVGGRVFIGSSDGSLYALEARDGSEVWAFTADAPVASSPAVAGEVVVFGDRANRFYAVSRSDGRLLWRNETGPDLPLAWGHEGWDYISSSPVVAELDGEAVVLFGSGAGVLLCVDPLTGEERWRFEIDHRIRATPAVSGGRVFFGGGDGVLYALALEDGRPLWELETTGVTYDAADFGFDRTQFQGSPVVVDGTVYVGSRDASLYAIDAASGEIEWERGDGSAWVINSPAVADGRVYSGRSSGGRFRARDAASGEMAWEFATGGIVLSSPAVAGELVYVGSGSGSVYALERATGAVRWRFTTEGPVFSTPVLVGDRLYIGSDDGSVYALAPGERPAPRLAVFYDDSLSELALWGGAPRHRAAVSYFENRGYERLDAAALAGFLDHRRSGDPILRGGAEASVVVLGMDYLPPELTDGGADSPLRQYLAAGGKVVWLGFPPGVFVRDDTGQITGVDRAVGSALLDVDLGPWNSDSYGTFPTETGRRWGWTLWGLGAPTVASASVDHILARDEFGRASAWVKEYGGPPGTGFVLLPATTDTERLREIRRVAEAGVTATFGG